MYKVTKLIGVIDDTSRKGKIRKYQVMKESLHD
jgi:hypothetical protein